MQGASNLRCWHGDWAVTSMPECIPGKMKNFINNIKKNKDNLKPNLGTYIINNNYKKTIIIKSLIEWFLSSAPCELPAVQHAVYSAGYRAGLTTAHGSSVSIHCERGYSPPAVLQCTLGDIRMRPSEPCQSIEGKNYYFNTFHFCTNRVKSQKSTFYVCFKNK